MKVDIKGPIIENDEQWIYDYFEIEATSPKKITEAIAQAENNEDIEVEINSGGGSVFAGSEMYTALKSYNGDVITKIVGLAASAATIPAMAGKKVLMAPPAQMMIHNASANFKGDYNAMEKGSEILKSVNASIANAYMLKTGMSQDKLLDMMNEETWMTPQQALENKFIDEIMFTDNVKLVASVSNGMLPQEVINKMKNKLLNEPTFKNKKESLKNEKEKLLIELDLI